MVEVTYHCPYCGAVTGIERNGYLRDECVTREPLEGWEYADTTGDVEDADGIEFVCLGTASGWVDANEIDGGDLNGVDGGDLNGVDGDNETVAGPGRRTVDDEPDGPAVGKDGCGRTFYLNYIKYEGGEEVSHRQPAYDRPRFDFRR